MERKSRTIVRGGCIGPSTGSTGTGTMRAGSMGNDDCPTCRHYAWDLRFMRPVRVAGAKHHPNCAVVRANIDSAS